MTVVLAVAAARVPFSSDTLRRRVIQALSDRLDAEVELDALSLRLLPGMRASGAGLRIHHKGRRDVPPLISVQSFTVDARLTALWAGRVDRVALKGLDIQIPPGNDDKDGDGTKDDEAAVDRPGASEPEAAADASSAPAPGPDSDEGTGHRFARQVVITEVQAPEARLVILRREAHKAPRTWYMHSLTLREVGLDRAMPFESVLTNAVPPGQVHTTGSFGPWNRTDPGRTPLAGDFTFDNADLSVFKGIAGTLSAKGTYQGELERIAVDGQTETPDFTIRISGHPMPLSTTYHAVVDGTNGNTTLDPVNATFAETSLVARGGVYDVEGVDGRVVKLDVSLADGRMQDVMRLAVNTPKPPMAGQLHLTTSLVIPPGDIDVADKLQLDGRFRIENGQFTDPGVQGKVNELSRRASGKTDEMPVAQRVTSDFSGRFKLGGGTIAIPNVTFDVPGAVVQLGGTYAMRAETIDFSGDLFMDAKISQTVTGFKSLLLKLADPLFRRDGKTVVPLKVHGSRNAPQFGLDMKRVFRRSGKASPAPRDAPPRQASSAAVRPPLTDH